MTYCAVIFSALFAGISQTIIGFGAGVVMMAVFPYFFDMITASAVSSGICLSLTVALAWKSRKIVRFKDVWIASLCYAGSSAVMIYVIEYLNIRVLTILFGVFLIFISVNSLFGNHELTVKPTLSIQIGFSLFSGCCAALFGIGGPLMAIYFLSVSEDHKQYIGNIQTVFAVANIVSFAARISTGVLNLQTAPLLVLGSVGICAGMALGLLFTNKINKDYFSKIIYTFVGVSGIITLIQQII